MLSRKMKRAHLLVVVAITFAFLPAIAQERLEERVPTGFVEDGKAISLEIIIFKPTGAGPFPTVMFNHGSTGSGADPSRWGRTTTSESIAQFFNERGWLVAFPQRRGRGKSDGLYDEGFGLDRSRYSCSPPLSLPGLEHALEDVDAVVEYLKARVDVDSERMLLGGVSRGGILSIVHAGTRPDHFNGVINFVGGWIGEGCPDPEAINTVSFRRGAEFQKPTLWLYGENDSFYSMEHSRKNFEAFIDAGGQGTFHSYSLGPGENGHGLVGRPDLWEEVLASFVEQMP